MILKALIVDDEALARDELVFLLKDHPHLRVVGQAANGPEALEAAGALAPHLVFLDIQMPGLNGFEVVEGLARLPAPPAVIFVTAYDAYAIEAFKVNAIDYLLKPLDKDRLLEAVTRARDRIAAGGTGRMLSTTLDVMAEMERQGGTPGRITLKHEGRYLLVDRMSVRYAVVKEGLVEVHAEGLTGTVNIRSLDELETLLGHPSFFRVNRSCLVNLDHVVEVVPWFSGRLRLKLADGKGTEITASRARSKLLKKILKV